MSADKISVMHAPAERVATAMAAQAAQAASGPEKAAPATPAAKAPELPQRAEIDYDPSKRREQLQEAIDKLNEQMRKNGRALEFGVDEKLNRFVVTVKNSETGHVVRQVPDETLLKVAHHLEDVKGLLQDERI